MGSVAGGLEASTLTALDDSAVRALACPRDESGTVNRTASFHWIGL
jgi:hypothetical protein